MYKFRVIRTLLRPIDSAVISSEVQTELLRNAARAKDPRPYPAHPFPTIADIPDLGTEMALGAALRRFGSDERGFQRDIVIGTTAIRSGRILVSSDKALVQAVGSIGGRAVYLP